VAAVYGGVGYREQKRALQRGVDVLVATPGRLEDLMDQRCVDLADVDIVTIDEADRMADMGFLPAVRRILATTRQERQTLLFSATLDGDVAVLAGKSQKDPVKVLADVSDDLELDLVHRFWRVDRSERLSHAVDVINTFERTIVFTRTRHGADRLARQLVKSGVPTVAMHGGRSQNQRTRALQAFSMGKARALVATDVAARGIHVDDVDVVLHYDLANDHKDYLHRSGRTGRAGASGTVISLVIGGQEKDVKKIQHAAGIDSRLDAPGRLEPARKRVSPPGRADLDVRSDRSPNTQQRAEKLRIYVGNLPWRVSDADLGSLFAEHGQVDRAVIATNRKSGRSKGYGLVDMPSGPAKRAISQLDGTLLDGRALRVRAAR
jgi:superfamily II DNA/RNA helicase